MIRSLASRISGQTSYTRQGYTLIEILVATLLALILMSVVFSKVLIPVSQGISDTRAGLEMVDRLRATQDTLRRDLENVTTIMIPPRHPETNEGYFEYIEGPNGPVNSFGNFAFDSETLSPNTVDTTVGDSDDTLIFTARNLDSPFVGRCLLSSTQTALESPVAEIAWFVRGTTLYRRVLLVAPEILNNLDDDGDDDIDSNDFVRDINQDGVVDINDYLGSMSFFNVCDVSARPVDFDSTSMETSWVPNSLADLTKRENRFAHRVFIDPSNPALDDQFPFDARRWGQLGLPTLQECSHPDWMTWADKTSYPTVTPVTPASPILDKDFWANPHPWVEVDPETGTLDNLKGPRVGEAVILTNVIGFDVKGWDPNAPVMRHKATGAVILPGDPGYPWNKPNALDGTDTTVWEVVSQGAYVDLNYADGNVGTGLDRKGHPKSGLHGGDYRVYDTGSFHYEHDGKDQDDGGDGDVDEGTDGFDSNDMRGVDDITELETRPPYEMPLRGIQIKIRVFEPDGRQVREVTIVKDFLKK